MQINFVNKYFIIFYNLRFIKLTVRLQYFYMKVESEFYRLTTEFRFIIFFYYVCMIDFCVNVHFFSAVYGIVSNDGNNLIYEWP